MTSGQKIAVTLLLSVLIFAGFSVVAFSGLFTVLETRFYQPAVVGDLESKLSDVTTIFDNAITKTQGIFDSDFVQNDSVKDSFLSNQTKESIEGRENASGQLMLDFPSLLGIRIIDAEGRRLHYSTFESDIFNKSTTAISYKFYTDIDALPFNSVQCPNESSSKIIFDEESDLILYSFPFYDSIEAYRGTIVFYTTLYDFTQQLIADNLIQVSDYPVIEGTFDKPIILMGVPNSGKDALLETIESSLDRLVSGVNRLVSNANDEVLVLLVNDSISNIKVAHWYNENLFVFPDVIKILLLLCVFITSYLIIFLIFNAKQDDVVVIKDRIKRLQLSLINEYIDNKDVDWNNVARSINTRKEDVAKTIKKSLGRRGKKLDSKVNDLLDKSWEDLMTAMGRPTVSTQSQLSGASADEIKKMLEQVLSSGLVVNTIQAPTQVEKQKTVQKATVVPQPVEAIEEIEELDEVEAIEEVEELDEVEAIEEIEELDDAEVIEEVEELDEAEAIEEIEELDDAEVIEEVEELDEAEAIEEIEELDEAEAIEEIEELDDAEVIEEVEELDEAEVIEEVEELGETEAIEEVEELDETEAIEEVEELDEGESIEVVEELDEAEAIEEVEDLAETEAIEEVEELDEAEVIEEIDELGNAEEIELIEAVEETDEPEEIEIVDNIEDIDVVEEFDDVEGINVIETPITEKKEAVFLEEIIIDEDDDFEIIDIDIFKKSTKIEEIVEVTSEFEIEESSNAGLETADNIQASDLTDSPKYEKVENVEEEFLFKEELVIGERDLKYKADEKTEDEDGFEAFSFDVASLDFSDLDEAGPVEDAEEAIFVDQIESKVYSSMNNFFTNQKTIGDAEAVEDSIVEEAGIFVIPKDLKIKYNNVDEEFKTLVDSILR